VNKVAKKLLIEKSYLTGRYTLAPEFFSLITTWRCNFQCQSCSIWTKTNFDELTEAEWPTVIANLTKTFPPTTFMEINGGEPLIRNNMVLMIIRELKKHFHTVALNSNGLLINEKIISELADAGLDILKVSFYSLDPTIHDSLRGNAQAFNHAKRAIELIAASPMKLEVGVLMTSKNIDGLPELIEYLQQFKNIGIILQPLDESVESPESKDMNANHLLSDLWPTSDQVHKFFNWVKNHSEKIKNPAAHLLAMERYFLNPPAVLRYRCMTGQHNCVVYPNGDVALCFKRTIIGNLKNNNIDEILRGSTAVNERRGIKDCQKYCRIIGCNFSRGFKELIIP